MCCHIHLILFAFIFAIIRLGLLVQHSPQIWNEQGMRTLFLLSISYIRFSLALFCACNLFVYILHCRTFIWHGVVRFLYFLAILLALHRIECVLCTLENEFLFFALVPSFYLYIFFFHTSSGNLLCASADENYKCKCYYSKATRPCKMPCIHRIYDAIFIICLLFFLSQSFRTALFYSHSILISKHSSWSQQFYNSMHETAHFYLHWFKYQFKST